MNRSLPWGWILLAAGLLLLPGPAGRLLIDLIGGLTLTLLLLPLLAGGAALIGWQLLKRRLHTCAACGFTSLATGSCPACGRAWDQDPGWGNSSSGAGSADSDALDPRDITINVRAVSVDSSAGGDRPADDQPAS